MSPGLLGMAMVLGIIGTACGGGEPGIASLEDTPADTEVETQTAAEVDGPIDAVSAVYGVDVYRTDLVPSGQTSGIAVVAAELDLLDTLQGSVAVGAFLSEATAAYPAVVLGSVATERLGIHDLDGNPVVWLGGEWFGVSGILEALDLSPFLDRAAIIGTASPLSYLEADLVPPRSTFAPTPDSSTR